MRLYLRGIQCKMQTQCVMEHCKLEPFQYNFQKFVTLLFKIIIYLKITETNINHRVCLISIYIIISHYHNTKHTSY